MRSRQLPSEGPVGPRCFSGLLGLSLMNGLNLNTAPLINGVWSDNLHLGPGSVGFLLTAQLLAAAIASIALSNRVHQIAPRRWGIAAGAALVAANLWLAYAGAYCALFGGIVVMGLGLGCLTACGAAAIARTLRVDRNAAIVLLGMTMLVAVLTVPVAHLAEASGRSGLFLSQAAVALAAVGLTALLPEPRVRSVMPQAMPLLQAMRSPLVLSAVCLEIGTAGIWAFTERIGAGIGLDAMLVGDIIAGTSLFGIAGALSATVVARTGREFGMAVVASIAFGVSAGAIAMAPSLVIFAAAMAAQAFFFVLAGPFVTAIGAAIDRSGGLNAAAHGWAVLTGSLAPALAGLIVEPGHFALLAILCLAATALSVFALLAARHQKLVEHPPAFDKV